MSEQFVYLIESILEIDKIEIEREREREREREGGETRKLKQLKVCYNCWMEKSRKQVTTRPNCVLQQAALNGRHYLVTGSVYHLLDYLPRWAVSIFQLWTVVRSCWSWPELAGADNARSLVSILIGYSSQMSGKSRCRSIQHFIQISLTDCMNSSADGVCRPAGGCCRGNGVGGRCHRLAFQGRAKLNHFPSELFHLELSLLSSFISFRIFDWKFGLLKRKQSSSIARWLVTRWGEWGWEEEEEEEGSSAIRRSCFKNRHQLNTTPSIRIDS